MTAVRWNKVRTAAAVLLAFAAVTPRAPAQHISSISGTSTVEFVSVTPGPPAGPLGNTIFEFSFGSLATQFNGAPIPVGNVSVLFAPTVTTITGTSTSGGVTTYALSPQLPATKTLAFFGPGQGGGTATFSYSFTEAVVNAASPNVVTFRGTETLTSDTSPAFDFSPFVAGGFLTVTVTGPAGTNFNNVLSADTPQFVSGTGTFTQVAVPEPATWALLGAGLPLLLSGYWRRRRA